MRNEKSAARKQIPDSTFLYLVFGIKSQRNRKRSDS